MIYLGRCGDHHNEMQLITYYAKYGWDTQTCSHEFHVDVENEMSWNGYNISFFFSFAKLPVVKTIIIWENCSRPLRTRAVQVNICHVVIHCSSLYAMISAHWVALVYSPQCLSTIYLEDFLLPGYEKGNFLNGGISFSVRKLYFIWPREITSTKKIPFSLCK